MAKLYSLEAIEVDEKQTESLLIDKLIKHHESKKDPVSVTADLLKQRQDLKKDIVKELGKDPEEPIKKEESEDTEKEAPVEDSQEKADSDDKEDKSKSDEDEGEDLDDLKGLVGSGLKEETAAEAFKPRISLSNLFSPITLRHNKYKASLEAYNLSDKATKAQEQPIAYVKESIQESLTNLAKVSQGYIDNNTTFKTKTASTLSQINEILVVFKATVDAQKYNFTNKLVSDKDILSNLSVTDKSDIRETVTILLNYIEQSNKALSMLFMNDFSDLSSSFLTNGYTREEASTDYSYSKMIPGFSLVKASIPSYANYLKTNVQDYQYYKVKTLKTEDIFNLNAISVSTDKDLLSILESLDKLLLNISLNVDNLSSMTSNFISFVEQIKATIFDLSENKFSNMTELNIDQKLKDFIKFKLGIEISYINVNTMTDYITTVMSVINECVEIKS